MLSRQPRLLRRCASLSAAATVVGILAMAGTAMASTLVRTVHPEALVSHVPVGVSHIAVQKTFAIPARAGRYSLSDGSAQALVVRKITNSPMTTISCTLSVTNPQYFQSTEAVVEGSAEVQCSATVSVLYVGVGLYFDGSLVNDSYAENFNVAVTSVETNYQYVAGYYQDGAVATIEFPSGYSPPSENLGEIYSSDVYINHL